MSLPRRGWLPAILLVGALLRFAAVPLAQNAGLVSDEREYLFLATRLQHGETFIDSNGDASVRSPLFPALLSLVPQLAPENLLVPLLLEWAFGVLAILLVYRLALAMWDNRDAALVAAGASALHPGLVVYSALLLTEMPFVLLFLLLLLAVQRYLHAPQPKEAVLIGILAGLATLMRGVFIVPFSLLILLLWMSFRSKGWSSFRRATFSLTPLLVCLAVLAPWTVRNYQVHYAFIPLSTFTGTSLVYGNNPYTHGSTKFDPGFEAWFREQRRERGVTDSAAVPEYERMKVDQDIAFEYARMHPWDTLKHMVQKMYVFWIYPLSHQQANTWLKLAMMPADILLYIGAALGIGVAKHFHKRLPLVWLPIVGFMLVHLVLHAEARYRVPVVPLVCMLFGGVALVMRNRKALMEDKLARRFALVIALAITGIYVLTTVLYVEGKV